ncbi:hypothetical protein E1295_14515 [Nonomuraea mesophila]|uniref:Uncharacterized protein n=1 Tax=Nonomuraea mesophila TaxID=2530382 RepID=A0A4R5FPG2_9ACTN|nr:hypothetical protein [Nonomuraea mesophila]TDE54616.1 hypothetical protein E1295_14515 [Nonomuraea mesophila]
MIASYNEPLPLAVPDKVPGRTLAGVWTIADDVLALDYAKHRQSELDVMVRISGSGDPRKECAAWERDFGSCRRLSADRWLFEREANGSPNGIKLLSTCTKSRDETSGTTNTYISI